VKYDASIVVHCRRVLTSLIVAVSVIVVFRVGGDSQDPEWLLAHSSASASISMDAEGGTTLTLFGPDKSIAMFTDRPERQTALISVEEMITNWIRGSLAIHPMQR